MRWTVQRSLVRPNPPTLSAFGVYGEPNLKGLQLSLFHYNLWALAFVNVLPLKLYLKGFVIGLGTFLPSDIGLH